jgi:hypothetical protein
MASRNAPRDSNAVPSALFENSVVPGQTLSGQIDQTTGRILVDMSGGTVISTSMQKDQFSATNNQTTFIPSKTPVFDFYMSVNGAIQTPSTDYSIVGGDYVLNAGVPQSSIVILLYSTT